MKIGKNIKGKVSDNILKRVYFLMSISAIIVLLILVKIVKIQWIDGDKWREMSENTQIVLKKQIADRGNILSDDGSILATSIPFYKIAFDASVVNPKKIKNFSDSLALLAGGLARNLVEEQKDSAYFHQLLKRSIKKKLQFVYLSKKPVKYDVMKAVSKLPILCRGRYKAGFIVKKINNKRFYPYKNLARITLGILEGDTTATRGIEFSYNKYLRGKDGNILVQKLPGNKEIPLNGLYANDIQDGVDIKTTLDVNMQDIVESSLSKAIKKHKAKYGVAILMEVKTGKIKALANYPENYNYAVARLINPGSTFKTASALIALESKAIKPMDSVETGDGKVKFFDKTFSDSRGYGKISFVEAFEKSSNVAFTKVINKHFRDKPEQFLTYLDEMRITEPINFQISGEPKPKVIRPHDQLWSGVTLPGLAIGYNIRLTPLQIITFFNAIANDGKMLRPYIVDAIMEHNEVIKEFKPSIIKNQIASITNIKTLQYMLQRVVSNGTAKNIKSSDYQIAGKTGTVKKLVSGEFKKVYQGSFAGYFPAKNPKYTLYVLIDQPEGDQYYGGSIAAPVFKEIADQIYYSDIELTKSYYADIMKKSIYEFPTANKAFAKDLETFYEHFNIRTNKTPSSKWAESTKKGQFAILKPSLQNKYKVPDVRGMSAKDAICLLENAGLTVIMKGHGKVKWQSLKPGKSFYKTQKILIKLD